MSSPKAAAAKTARRPRAAGASRAAKRVQTSPAAKPAGKPAERLSRRTRSGSAAEIERALAERAARSLEHEALQALMAAVCRVYAAQVEAGEQLPPLAERGGATATDVMVTASGLLKAANLAVFELGMWQSWTGR